MSKEQKRDITGGKNIMNNKNNDISSKSKCILWGGIGSCLVLSCVMRVFEFPDGGDSKINLAQKVHPAGLFSSAIESQRRWDMAHKRGYEGVSATYLGLDRVKRSKQEDRGYISFDTDGNPRTVELEAGIDSPHLFKAGASLKDLEGQTMKIAEWRRLPGLEEMFVFEKE